MLLLLLFGLGVGTTLGESTSMADSDDSPSTINARWLKSKSAARDISYSSSFGSEDFDSPDIPSDFHARWGINKTWYAKTPHPILSRRASFEDYGKVPPSPDSFDEESPEEEQSTSSEREVTENTNSRMTSLPNPLTSNKNFNEKIHQTTLKSTITSQTKVPSSLGKQKPTSQVKAVGTTRKSTEKVSKAPQVPTQLPTAMIKPKVPPSDETLKATDMPKTESLKYLSSTTELITTKATTPFPDADGTNTYSTAHSTIRTTTSNFLKQVTTGGQKFSTLPPLSTLATSQFKTRSWESFPKMDRSKKRRGVIVLKPPPEDWPEPNIPEGAKPPPPEFGATLPPMGTQIDTRLGRKGKGHAASFASPPYLGHRKIDFVPQYDKATASDSEASPTVIPSMKWRIRGRRDRKGLTGLRQKGGGYLNEMGQEPGFRKDLTMKPPSRYYIAENTTFLVPTVRNTRPYQRSYFNFRMRYPMNVGRAFGPPEPPPYGQPPPPHFAPNNPYGHPPYPQFPQRPYPPYPPHPMPPRYGPPPPYGQRPPPHVQRPPPAFVQGVPHPYRRGPPLPPPYIQPPPPPYDPYSPPPPEEFDPPPDPLPESAPPPPPPSPYPTGPDLPPVHPFLDGIPTISPIDKGPAPWPRRQVPPEFRPPQPRVPEFLRQEPRNFSGYKGPRRGRAYEQYGKADLRPRHTKFFDEFAVRGTPRFPIRKGSGFGVEFQTDITGPPEVLGDFFAKRTWPTRSNKYGYEPYRRSDDRKRPYGFGRYAVQRPPILGDFGEYKPYKRVDDSRFVGFNFSRPTRSYTFPPRLRLAIKNASYYRRAFRRTGFQGYALPTLPSIGLAAYLAQNHDYYGNPITPKGRITNLEDLKLLFTWAPTEEEVEVTTVIEKEKKAVKPRLTAKPKGMTAREAMRAAAREAIKEAEMENWEVGDRGGRRRGWRRVGGGGGGRGTFIRRGGARGSGMSPRNFRRAKRSLEEEVKWLKRHQLLQQRLETGGNYMTDHSALRTGSQERHHSRVSSVPLLRMYRWRSKGRPLRRG